MCAKKMLWKVLIVDDDFLNRKLILDILKNHAQCDVAVNGYEAIEAYNLSIRENKYYDVILLDIAMPDLDGIAVLHKIRENEARSGIKLGEGVPIIMTTAYVDPVVDAFNKGCDDYIVTPIDPEGLINKIKEKVRK